jgi:cytochrome c553
MRSRFDSPDAKRRAALVAGVAVALAACGNGSTSVLTLPGRDAPGQQMPSGAPATSTQSSPPPVAEAGTGSGSGSGGSTSSDAGATSTSGDAGAGSVQGRALFEALLTSLGSTCGGACHAQGAGGAPLWLGPPDPYVSAVQFPGIVVSNPGTSIVITKGRHEGPPLADPLLTQVTQWLTAEAAALPVVTLPQTPPFTVAAGANNIDCSKGGVAGVHITFDATISGDEITLSNLDIVAPAATGVHIVYPIFAVLPTGGAEIDDPSFSNEDQTVAAGQTAPLGPGLLILTDWSAGAQMKIEFTTLAAATVADGGLTGGCKSVADFTSDAYPAIQANTCLTCHGKGGSGNSAMDLSALQSTPPDYTTACAQALPQINPQNPAQSQIILAPTGQAANHPFKNASQSFVTMMETWIAAEK